MRIKNLSLTTPAASLLLGLLLSSPASAQNVLTRPAQPESGRDVYTPVQGVYHVGPLSPLPSTAKLAWNSDFTTQNDATEISTDELSAWSEMARGCVFSSAQTRECVASIPPEIVARLNTAGSYLVRLRDRNADGVSPPAGMLQVEASEGCLYASPSDPNPPTLKPIGHVAQGSNAAAGQTVGLRIFQLRAWGYRVEWQYIKETDRVFMIAWCVGTPQN